MKSPRKNFFHACALLAATGAFSTPAHAGTYTWDADGVTAGVTDGAGTWSTGAANWFDGSSTVVWPNNAVSGNSDLAVIGNNNGAAGTVAVSGAINLNGITFNAPGSGTYIVSGASTLNFGGADPTITANNSAAINSLTLSSQGANPVSINVASGQTLTTGSAAWSGTGGFTKDGAGTLTMTGGNNATHDRFLIASGSTFTMNAGTMNVSGTYFTMGETGAGASAYTQTGGAFKFTGTGGLYVTNVAGSGPATVSVSGGTFTEAGTANFVRLAYQSNATVNVSGTGSMTLISELSIGTGNIGVVNLSDSGTITSPKITYVGNNSSGTWNQTGGTANLGQLNVGQTAGATTALISVSGGTFNASGNLNLGVLATGTLTVSGGAVNLAGTFNLGGTASGVVNLNGGTLKTIKVTPGSGASKVFNFDGGTLQAGASSTTFMTGLTTANVKNGGAIVDTNGFNVEIGQALVQFAGATTDTLTKLGGGTLTLSGTNTYAGNTAVNGGTLLLTGSVAGPASVGTTGTLAGGGTVAGATTIATTGILSPGNSDVGTLNLGSTLVLDSGSTYAVSITAAATNDKVIATGALTANGTIAVTLSGYVPVAGNTFDLADSAGSISGTPTFDFTAATLGAGLVWDTSDFATNGTIKVVASGTTYSTWINGFTFAPGADKTPTGDPDADGVSNGAEMVLGGDPATGMDSALQPTIELVNTDLGAGATNYLLFTYRRSDLSVTAGVTSGCETDTDLSGPWTPAVNASAGVVILTDDNYTFTPPAAANTDRVRVYVPRGVNTTLFGRLNVLVP